MILKVIHQVLLAMLAKEVELDLAGRWCPLKIVEGLRGLDLGPTWSRFHDSLHNILVVPKQQDILVKLRSGSSLVERK